MRLLTIAVILTGVEAIASGLKVLNLATTFSKKQSLQKRQNPVSINLEDHQSGYGVKLSIGTPPQEITVDIAVDSGDSWVPGKNSALCQAQPDNCTNTGNFDPGASQTLKQVNGNAAFSIVYSGEEEIQGTYYLDNVTIGSATVNSLQFAVGTNGSKVFTPLTGILGLGYDASEISGQNYSSFVSALAQQGLINTKTYSVWLNDPSASNGNILFGGIDFGKFSEPLIAVPIIPGSNGQYTQPNVALTSVSFSSDLESLILTRDSFSEPASINPGYTYSYLPDDVVNNTLKFLGGDSKDYVSCNLGNDPTAQFTFNLNGFDGAQIVVPLSDMLFPTSTTVQNGEAACLLGIQRASQFNNTIHLGDSFMRAAYVVYDLTNNYIAFAQAAPEGGKANIQEISSGGIPGASTVSTIVPGLNTGTQVTAAFETGMAVPTFAFTATAAPTRASAAPSGGGQSSSSSSSKPTASSTSSAPATSSSGSSAISLVRSDGSFTFVGFIFAIVLPWLC